MSIVATSAGLMFAGAVSTYHADTAAALAYLTGQGVALTEPQKEILDRHVRDLHGEVNPNYTTVDIWAKIRAAYPMIGGTAAAHTLNLRNPAQPLTFSGTMTHSATGIAFSGGHGNTGFDMTSQPVLAGGGYYSRTNHSGSFAGFLGASNPTGSNQFAIVANIPGGQMHYNIYGNSPDTPVGGQTSTVGYFSMSRTSPSDFRAFKNGAQVASNPIASLVTPEPVSVYIGDVNVDNMASVIPITAACAYCQINYGLTPAEELAYYNAIQAFQTALGRQV